MRRLERHQKKIFIRNLILTTAALIFLMIFIFIIGIKVLLSSVIFISQLIKKDQNKIESVKTENFFGNLDITDIPTATNSSRIYISGRSLNYDIITIFLNEKKIKEIKANDNFEEIINGLEEGTNQIYLLAKSEKTKNTEKTPVYNVLLKTSKPTLEIIEPNDNSRINNEEIKISGKTDKDSSVEVNNLPIVVNALGNFETFVKLQPGENKIIVSASDIAGNLQSKTITVIYEKN